MGTLERLLCDLTWIETVFESILRFGVSQNGMEFYMWNLRERK